MANGNATGYAEANGFGADAADDPWDEPPPEAYEPPAPPPEPPRAEPARRILVTLRLGGDTETEKQRLNEIYRLFLKYPGQDRFCVHVWRGGGGWELDFPNTTTSCCDALLEELRGLVPPDGLRVE